MEIEVKRVTSWERAVDAARFTVHKEQLGHEPSDAWKHKVLMAEHSPIRLVEYDVIIREVPYFIIMHLVRHNQGIEKFVATSREDRTGVPRNQRLQTDLIDAQFSLNAQALINISRKRICHCADKDTRKVWRAIVEAVRKVDPEVAKVCVRECVYRGFCPEMETCGYTISQKFIQERKDYIGESRLIYGNVSVTQDAEEVLKSFGL